MGRVLFAEGISSFDAVLVRGMLKDSYETVKKYYYDPAFRGLDWEARYQDYRSRIATAASFNAGLGIVAAFLDGLNDSHTRFQPPKWVKKVDYGYDMAVVGDDSFIVRVRPGSDAASKLHVGDRVVSISGNEVTRESFDRMQYILAKLSPQVVTQVVLRNATGEERTELVRSTVTDMPGTGTVAGPGTGFYLSDLRLEWERERWLVRQRSVEMGSVMIWKMPTFFAETTEIDRMLAKARKYDTLVLDLRGNPGGLGDVLRRLVGGMFQEDVVIGTRITRTGASLLMAPSRGRLGFEGRLIVLIDSGSGSSAELFARVVQLDQRGLVIGDRSAGVVREGRVFPFSQGVSAVLSYAVAVSSAEIVMKDGLSLEGEGVTPDELVLPTADDLAAGRDPVLAHALQLAGVSLDSEAAARLFQDK